MIESDPPEFSRGGGLWRAVMAGIWLIYLSSTIEAAWARHDIRGGIGIAATILFALIYISAFVFIPGRLPGTPLQRHIPLKAAIPLVSTQAVLGVAICLLVGQAGTATAVYIAVLGVMCLRAPYGLVVAAAVAAVTYSSGILIPGWDEDRGLLFGIAVATLAVWGIRTAIARNIEVMEVREENTRLAAAEERNKLTRDLHDIIGHSLTVITVKAELANRLLDVDVERARNELKDLERLSRDALSDVRRTLAGHREITLSGEIARARSALSAANIRSRLPNTTDDVPTELRELFAWSIREGVTNVLRHSGARNCTVVLHPDSVEVSDDGQGGTPDGSGIGHTGLRERAQIVGGRVVTQSLDPGFRLRVEVTQ
ncbi:MAG: histidine kinase [Nocardiaceae bacterium]|nr:histidine kinase [Nocardiaceae bacterium]